MLHLEICQRRVSSNIIILYCKYFITFLLYNVHYKIANKLAVLYAQTKC